MEMHQRRWKWSGQIPAFGDWEHANEMPITQYFECARQAGLIRYTSSGECDQYMRGDLYATDFKKPSRELGPPRKKKKVTGFLSCLVPGCAS
ncbi:hypothetical protein GH714_005310 [Hevea brasiliensis]|uniref:RIN4 pathogenic type III effector avirulence factor Avr cleavage site domain-containing protein n=1 Tax=Hevea brasiliensis TaxID=3981 RepID=A0A6A6KIJ2_HEVBR|nr:hypothetical protein GH714_005310 [Hevea brasiliensis]